MRHADKVVCGVAVAIVLLGGVTMGRCEDAGGDIYDIPVTTIDGRETTLEAGRGKVMLIVNTASRCGFTGQYAGLQKLYEQYGEQGLVVMGFPSNDFLGQEPGTNEEIKQFCESRFDVTFPMFEKIVVKGDGQHPLYALLTAGDGNAELAGDISWNFNKFLVGRDGRLRSRFGSRVKPESDELQKAIVAALKREGDDNGN